MTEKMKGVLAAMAAVAALAIGGAAIAGAAGGGQQASEPVAAKSAEPAEKGSEQNDSEAPIGGTDLDKAGAAALEHTGGGQVTETEVGDEESYYEVEVTRDDGSQVDVQLDRSFAVVGASADSEGG
jgi:uncharacterized membrane protein YkoI